jgi:ACS family glucarate transporter-like MFS transporter
MSTITTNDPDRMRQLDVENSNRQVASDAQRRWVIAALVGVSFLTILARVGISGAKLEMARDLGLGDVSFGLVFGAFALGYAVFMVPAGLMADHWGPRKSLAFSVFFWSLFTLCTGLATGILALLFIRLLFGLAEAGVFPQATRALHNWTLPRERGLALGLLNMGSRLGAAFGLAISPIAVEQLGWRQSFVALGIVGLVWAVIWFCWFRDRPLGEPGPGVADAGGTLQKDIRRVARPKFPVRAFLASRNFYLLIYQYFASQFTFFICLTWLLPFAKTRYSITSAEAGIYSSIPLYCGALAMWIGGTAVDRIYRTGRWKLSRALPSVAGFALATVTILPAPFMHSVGWFIACFALTTFGLDLTISASWTACCDVGGSYSGTLSAAMNTSGALGSLVSSMLFPLFLKWTGSITIYFCVAAFLNLIAVVCWMYIEPGRPLLVEGNIATEQKF